MARISSPLKRSTIRGTIPCVFSFDHALTWSASSGPVSSVSFGPAA